MSSTLTLLKIGATDNPAQSSFPKDGGDDSAEKYRGGRDKDNLVKFINKKLGAEPEEIEEVCKVSGESRKEPSVCVLHALWYPPGTSTDRNPTVNPYTG